MASNDSSQYYTQEQCINYLKKYGNDDIQEKLDSTMPWIGLYIAAASAACAIAMAADVANGFRKKKLWFPCKYFSLNAFTLTVLAVAMKLPSDLTSKMLGVHDRLSRVSGLVLMSTAMANFMASLGSMDNNEIMLNLAALIILVITISGNIYINIFQVRYYHAANLTLCEKIGSTVFMLLLLVILCSTGVMIPTAKRYIESQYNQMHKRISNELVSFTADELRVAVRRYWMLAESGSPQFVIARSVTCVASGLMCLLMDLTLLEAHIRLPLLYKHLGRTSSNYKWSTSWVLFIQSSGVALGTIAPLLRWLTTAQFKSTKIGHKSFRDEFKVEVYWTQMLKHWRDSPLPLTIGHHKFRKFLHDAKRLLLNLCIGAQILIVMGSKLVLLLSAVFVKGLLFCYSKESDDNSTTDCYSKESDDNSTTEFESRYWNAYVRAGPDFSRYVLLLEGEAELPKRILESICSEVDELIQKGKRKKSKNISKLLQKSVNFNGVREFDSDEIEKLSSQEPPNCWSLPVVTLTSIAISLPNIPDKKSDKLLSAVSEGLYFARLIEKTLDLNGELASIREAADVAWVGVELYRKWLDKDLHNERLQNLSNIAEKTITHFMNNADNFLVDDPLNWPVKVIAANSMYRITNTILLAHHYQTDEELFERLSIMISDILVACLTNLARVIIMKCHICPIKDRERNVREAAVLLGECEEILEIVQLRELPGLDPERAGCIEGWRAFMKWDISVTSNETTSPNTDVE